MMLFFHLGRHEFPVFTTNSPTTTTMVPTTTMTPTTTRLPTPPVKPYYPDPVKPNRGQGSNQNDKDKDNKPSRENKGKDKKSMHAFHFLQFNLIIHFKVLCD